MCTEARPIYLGAEQPFLGQQWNTPSYGPLAGPYSYPTVGSLPEWKQMYPELYFCQPPTTRLPGYPSYPYICKPEGEYLASKPWESKSWEMKKPYGSMPWESKPINMSYWKDTMCTKEPCYPYYHPETECYPIKPFGAMPWEVKANLPFNYVKDTKEGCFPYTFRPEWFPTTYGPKPWENKTVFPGMPYYKEYIKDTCYPYSYKPEGECFPSKPWESKPYGPFPMSTPVNMPYPPMSYPYEKTYPSQPYGPLNKPFPPTMYPINKPYGAGVYPMDQECQYPRKPFYGPVNKPYYPLDQECQYPRQPFCGPVNKPYYPLEKDCGYPINKPYGPFPEYKSEPNWQGEYPNQYTYGYGHFPNGQQSSVLGG